MAVNNSFFRQPNQWKQQIFRQNMYHSFHSSPVPDIDGIFKQHQQHTLCTLWIVKIFNAVGRKEMFHILLISINNQLLSDSYYHGDKIMKNYSITIFINMRSKSRVQQNNGNGSKSSPSVPPSVTFIKSWNE